MKTSATSASVRWASILEDVDYRELIGMDLQLRASNEPNMWTTSGDSGSR
jgi:hypothetical protein